MLKGYWLIEKAREFYRDVRDANPSLTLPKIGIKIPLKKDRLKPTRVGFDPQDRAPFIHSDPQVLFGYYHGYKNSLEHKIARSPYAESVALKNGSGGFEDGIDCSEFQVQLLKAKWRFPRNLRSHKRAALELFSQLEPKPRINYRNGTWENNQSARVNNWDNANRRIDICRATYFDQVGTNLTVDWASHELDEHRKLATLRHLEPAVAGCLCPLRDSMLANTLGIAAVLVDREDNMLIRIRARDTAVMNREGGEFHCSASGVFDLERSGFPMRPDFTAFERAMQYEIQREIGLRADQYSLSPMAFTRELPRAGKPQLFFIARTDLAIEQILPLLPHADESWEFTMEGDLPGESPLYPYLDRPSRAPPELFSWEGLMAFTTASACLLGETPPFRL